MNTRMPRRSGMEEDAEDFSGEGDEDQHRRATLLESEAEELRRRLDGLLAEIGRHHRTSSGALATLRRFAPALIVVAVGAAGLVAMLSWRRHRQWNA